MADHHALLLEIAPIGVYPQHQLPDTGVSSYLTFSPLPAYAKASAGRPDNKLWPADRRLFFCFAEK